MGTIFDYMVAQVEGNPAKMQKAISAISVENELSKAAFTGAMIEPGGVVTELASKRYFDNVTDQSSFLGRVSSERLTHLKANMDYFTFGDEVLQRVAEGTAPTTFTGVTTAKKTWELLDTQLFAQVMFSMLENKIQSQPNMEAYLFSKLAMTFKNDFLRLAISGDIAGGSSDFYKLNDGWLFLADAAVDGTGRDLKNKRAQRVSHGTVTGTLIVGETVTGDTSGAIGVISVIGAAYLDLVDVVGTFEATTPDNISGGTSSATADLTLLGDITVDYMGTMDAMIEVMTDKYCVPGIVEFIMNPKDAFRWGKQMAYMGGLNPYLITGNVPKHEGYSITQVPYWPAGTIMMTNPKNLGFAMGRNMQNYKEIEGTKRCIDWTWNLYSDFEVYVDDMIVYSD